jgi:hypothetical protein
MNHVGIGFIWKVDFSLKETIRKNIICFLIKPYLFKNRTENSFSWPPFVSKSGSHTLANMFWNQTPYYARQELSIYI